MTTTITPTALADHSPATGFLRGLLTWKTAKVLVPLTAAAVAGAAYVGHQDPANASLFPDCSTVAQPDTSVTADGLYGGVDPKGATVTTRVWTQDPFTCTWHEAPAPGRG